MIEITDLRKSFDSNDVLRGIDITIHDGETVAIIGESGCGKSVLLKHIIGLMHPDSGTVTVDGISIPDAKEEVLYALRRRIGFLFQSAALFDSMTVYENVVLGLWEAGERDEDKLREIATEKLGLVGLRGILDSKPSSLSGGMKKRVGLARALAMQPQYMFYDEPTTGLDPVTSDQIDFLILSLTERLSTTNLIVTHDLFTVNRIAKRVIYLNKGLIFFDGTPQELMQSSDRQVMQFVERFVR
ncbi:MAG: ATP-binding cassette domain-containing protein [Bacteroidota bacterium]|nr:ATP-binding cassette domain-containing protein [Bacteroidota bacterium]MDP4229672.1 ATP-binding cassette domain-containing protein [Bacteroidota bacterium]MDP4237063.1 ATP-binding cassette domain-containing protein [Bacteroidota bacterium]